MEWLKNNGDRVALLVVSIVAIAASGLMIAKSFSFSDDFVYDHVTGDERKREVPPTGAASVEQSTEAIGEDVMWKLAAVSGKPEVPIFKSVVLIQKGSQIYDLNDPSEQLLRPPMKNSFFLLHNLDYTRSDVGLLDPDDDGFHNLEEFNGVQGVSTDPTDPNSHPPLTNKVFVKQRIEIPYTIEFTSVSGDLYGVREKKNDGKESRLFVRKDQEFFDRFKVIGFRSEERFDERLNITREVGILTVQDLVTKEDIELVQRVPQNLPSFIGVFLNTLKVDIEIQVKKGELFRIPGDPRQFLLGEIMESEAVIVPSDAEGKPLPGESKIRIASLSTRNSGGPPPGITPGTPDGRPLRLPPGAPGTTPVPPDGTTPAPPGTTVPTPPAGTATPAPPAGTTPVPPAGTTPAPPAGTTAPVPPAGTAPAPGPPGT